MKALPSISSKSQLPPCHRRIGCLLSQSRGIFVRIHIAAHPAIFDAPTLTKANLAEVGHLPAGKAIVTESSRDAPSFARASRGVAPGPTRCILGRQVELGCCTREALPAGRCPWRVVRCEIYEYRAVILAAKRFSKDHFTAWCVTQ